MRVGIVVAAVAAAGASSRAVASLPPKALTTVELTSPVEENTPPEYTRGRTREPGHPTPPAHSFGRADFGSYYQAPPLAAARRLYVEGRHTDVRSALAKDTSFPASYLRAMSAWALNHPSAASELLALTRQRPLLESRWRLLAAGAALKQSRFAAAIDAALGVSRSSQEYIPSLALLAQAQRRLGRLDAARGTLQTLLSDASASAVTRMEAYSQLLELARARRDRAAQRAALVALWSEFPEAPMAKGDARWLARQRLSLDESVTRVEALVRLHRNRDALRELSPLLAGLPLPSPLACRAHFARGLALRKERRHAQAIPILREVLAACADKELRTRTLYVLGYSESVVEPAAAIGTYEALASYAPDGSLADDALFYASELRMRAGDPAGALAALARITQGDFAADARFRQYWYLRSIGDHRGALASLEGMDRLEGLSATHQQVQRAQYWTARSLAELGKAGEAKAQLLRVASEGALTYYGLLAYWRLTKASPESAAQLKRAWGRSTSSSAPASDVFPLDAGALARDETFRAGVELLRLGDAGAGRLLASVKRRGLGEEPTRLLFHLLREGAHVAEASVIARSLINEGFVGSSPAEARSIYEAAFPSTYRELVERHSRAAAVEPSLMQALIREESAFNPSARSPTGALGLSQLMPQTARRVARSLRGPRFSSRALLEPRHNIRWGSAYLGSLQRQFEGNPVHAVASYNAGPGAVGRWLQRGRDASLDTWVEEIPIEETRRYVKRVLGSYATYELLEGRAPPPPPPGF